MTESSGLSIDEQQWLLIIRAGGLSVEIPGELREALTTKGLMREDGALLVLTDNGAAEATRIAAADLELRLPPRHRLAD
jgi:hypothetical protein